MKKIKNYLTAFEGIIFFTHKVNIYFLLLVIVFTQNREIHVTEYKKF